VPFRLLHYLLNNRIQHATLRFTLLVLLCVISRLLRFVMNLSPIIMNFCPYLCIGLNLSSTTCSPQTSLSFAWKVTCCKHFDLTEWLRSYPFLRDHNSSTSYPCLRIGVEGVTRCDQECCLLKWTYC
jgi:hypothetical protein